MHDPQVDVMPEWRQALWIVLAATLARLLLGAVVPLFPDEAYYWEWSRRLAGGYFDHPPVIAWLIAGGTSLLGDTPLGVRLLPIAAGGLLGVAIARTACHLAGPSAARFAALCYALAPGWALGLVLATPDAPMLALMACSLYGVVRAVGDDLTPREGLGYWVFAGVTIGLAMAAKYTAVFLPVGVAAAFVVAPRLRHQLKRPGPWVAVALASLVMLPVLRWNAQHEWISFRFQLNHGLAATPDGSLLARELELLGGQMGLMTPVLFVVAVVAVIRAFRAPRDAARLTLGVVALSAAAVFVVSATRHSVEPNWPMTAWAPAIVLLAALRPAMRTRWEHAAVWMAGVATLVVVVQAIVPFLPLPATRDPVSRAYGWRELARTVGSETERLQGEGRRVFIAANRYQDAALIAWYLREHPPVTSLNLGGRANQYDLWPRVPDDALPGADLLLVLKDTSSAPPEEIEALRPHFASASPGHLLPLHRGAEPIAVRRLWQLSGWTGTLPATVLSSAHHPDR